MSLDGGKQNEDAVAFMPVVSSSARVTGPRRVELVSEKVVYRTNLQKPAKVGLLMVGWGGNNGSTLTAALVANRNRVSWRTRTGRHGMNLADALDRAQVLEPELRDQVRSELSSMVPMRAPFYADFVAGNQAERADNVLPGGDGDKAGHLAQLRGDLRAFRAAHPGMDKVFVVWTANTERLARVDEPGVHDSADALLRAIQTSHPQVSCSTLFGVAAALEGAVYINGSPQNTFVPGLVDLATRCGTHVAGDDFKSGQTKLKSVLVDFLVGAGLRPVAIASYNHLGNNDGRNLSEAAQFRAKELSKTNVVDDMVASNPVLYPPTNNNNNKSHQLMHMMGPDHLVVIKYVPAVGDSKRAMDEYETEIFMGGRSTIAVHNVCEDSLLAAPLILDLVLLAELLTRVKTAGKDETFRSMNTVLSLLSYMLKAPLVPEGRPVVNALFKQRAAIENLFRALVGLPPVDPLCIEQRLA
ncbi:unnamed protein product [Notodromas monacha]|uniref:Inositol-3-phosphate synthase n=1 Tax=Notodromas monacha TaxID=399045 RepID=A0A7R9BTW1_9CRUS|nr:unnamed protein product [Notodromas monacha]CAG0920273.1 unnamed protein product [Notodromas monacha]